MPESIQGRRYLWEFRRPNPKIAQEISQTLEIPHRVALLLTTRQITSPHQARDFLHCRLENLPFPDLLPDLDRAVARIVLALEQGEQLAVYGDYDVDGLTATALLVQFLSRLGGKVCWYLPHRIKEGYGLNNQAVHYLHSEGVSLVITVDCGSSDHDAIQQARKLGLDVIVTDHHHPPDCLPESNALVNPKLKEDREEYRDLAGVGIAFYLAAALRAHFRHSQRWTGSRQPNLKDDLDLVALGTLADVAPLTSTNRILTRVGLQVLSQTSKCGLQALKEVSGLEAGQVSDWDVLFRLGPRLNAPGRLGNGELALRLLLSTDPGEARELAEELEELNRQRQSLQENLWGEALALIEDDASLLENRSLILNSSDWHKGLLGIVASRLVERFNKPTILLTRTDEGWEGSGRSPKQFDLYRALCRCREHLVRFGGHRLAAGLALHHKQLPGFRAAFDAVVQQEVPEDGIPRVKKVDGVVRLEEITPDLMSYLDRMRPFGAGNPEPAFCCQDFQVEHLRVLKDKHLQLKLRQEKVAHWSIGFNLLESGNAPHSLKQLLFSPRWNYWQGERKIQLHIIDYC